MNWFNLRDLQKRLVEGAVSDKEGFYYILANWLLFGTISFAAVHDQRDNPGVMVMLIFVPLIGLFLTFKANQRGDNKDYLKRFISLHFVIGIRFIAFTILLAIPVSAAASLIENIAVKGFLLGGFITAMGIAFYYSLAASVKKVSKGKY